MRIGIDFDDTLVDTFSKYHKYFAMWEEKDKFKDIYHLKAKDWDRFFDAYWDEIYKEVEFFPDVYENLLKLNNKGYQLVLVSSRYGPCTEYAIKQIKDAKLPINEFVFTTRFKSDACIKNNIDLMIDDNDLIISDLKKHHIKCLKKGKSRKFKHLDNWCDIVEYICKEAK